MNIEVTKDNVIINKNSEKAHENEYRITECEFVFDVFTNSFQVKRAIFTILSTGEMYEVDIINNKCNIPSEVLEHAYETVKLGVYGYNIGENDELLNRFSPSYAEFVVPTGSYEEGAQSPEEITPSQYDLYSQALQEGLQEVDDKLDEVVETVDGKLEEVDTKLGEVDTKLEVVDEKIEDVDNAITRTDEAIARTNNLNLDVSDKVDGDVTVTLTKKDASTKSVVISDGTSLQFMWQGTSLGIKTDDMEEYVFVDLQGIQGIKGDTGEPFTIKKTYSSVAEMNADFNNMEYGDYVMIASSVEVEDNAKLYTRGESQWIFITDFSGATGIRGPVGATPNIQIGTVTSGSTPSVTRTGTDENPILNFVLQPGPQGEAGPTGLTGNGISSIEKTSTSGLLDTYTITFTNGNTTTFDVTNGKGIDRIEKTATVGNVDTYTIYFNDNSTSTFEVANGEVTKEELQEEVDRLSMIYNLFPTTSDEDTEMTLDGTGEVKLKKIDLKGNTSQVVIPEEQGTSVSNTSIYVNDVNTDKENTIEMSGNTYQESTTGKNLLPNEATTKTKNGITFTKNSDGTYTVSGTATANAVFPILVEGASTNPTLQAGTYTLSGCPSGGSVSVNTYKLDISVGGYNQDVGSGVTFTLSEATQINYVRILVYNGQTINAVFKPMIEIGNTKTSFEPYTGGNPSPNPDYPQDIQVVTGENDITIYKENLFNGEMELGMIDYDTGLNTQNNNRARAKGYIPLFSNTFSIIREEAFSSGQTIGLRFYDSNFNYIGRNAIYNFTNYATKSVDNSLDTTKSVAYMRIILVSTNDMSKKFCVVNGESTTFDSTIPQTYPVNLGNIELCKIGDYQDRIYKDNGKWYIHKDIGKVILDGSEDWNSGSSVASGTKRFYYNNTLFYNDKNNYSNTIYTYSNMFKSLGWEDIFSDDTTTLNACSLYCNSNGIGRISIRIDNTYATDLAGFKTWLNSNNTTCYFALATPTTTEITDTNLVNQLNVLYNATIYSTTNINTDTSNLLPYIDLHYNFVTPSPSPSRPSAVNVVTGDNTIKVEGKNLVNFANLQTDSNTTYTWQNDILEVKATTGTYNRAYIDITSLYKSNPGKELRLDYNSLDFSQGANPSVHLQIVKNDTNTYIDLVNNSGIITPRTIPYDTSEITQVVLRIVCNNTNTSQASQISITKPILHFGETVTTYTPYTSQTYPINLGSMELCKIGDYQDCIRKSTGKNLFDKNSANILMAHLNRTTNINSNISNSNRLFYLPIKPNTTYTIQKLVSLYFVIGTTEVLPDYGVAYSQRIADSTASNLTITTSSTAKYLICWFWNSSDTLTEQQILDSIQVEENSQATTYEPYGKVWYLHKDIGKYTFTGNENWNVQATDNSFTTFQRPDVLPNTAKATNFQQGLCKSNYFKTATTWNIWVNTDVGIDAYVNRILITIPSSIATTKAQLNQWLQEHNVYLDYVLETPTITEITDTTLIEQLDNLEKAYSYDTQTSITQTNDDMPFILDVEAILSLKGVLN